MSTACIKRNWGLVHKCTKNWADSLLEMTINYQLKLIKVNN